MLRTPLLSASDVIYAAVSFTGEIFPHADLSRVISPDHETYFTSKYRVAYTRNVLRTVICLAFMDKYGSPALATARQRCYTYVRHYWNVPESDYVALVQEVSKLLHVYSRKQKWISRLCRCCKSA